MKQSTRILMTFVGIAIGGFVGLCFTFALGMAACGSVNSSGFLSEDQCKQGWGAFAYLAFIAGLVGGGIWGYKVLGGKSANWVIGSEEQTVSKNLPAGINIGDTKVACLSCGASMDVDGLFCGSCGAPKQEADTSDSDGTTYEPKVTLTTPSPSDKIKRWPRLLWVIPILWFTGVVGSNIGLWLAGVFLLLSLCLVIPSLSNKLIRQARFGILVILILLFTYWAGTDMGIWGPKNASEQAADQFFQAVDLFNQGLSEEAMEKLAEHMESHYYRDTHSQSGGDPAAYTLRARIYFRLGIKECPRGHDCDYGAVKEFERSVNDWEKVLSACGILNAGVENSQCPKAQSESHLYMSTFPHLTLGRYDRARELANRVIASDPTHGNAYHNRGRAYFGLGKYERAMEDYNKAIDIWDDRSIYYMSRFRLFRELGKSHLAENDLRLACELEKQDRFNDGDPDFEEWCSEDFLSALGGSTKAPDPTSTHIPPTATPVPTATPNGLNHFEQGEQYLWRDENYVKAVESFTEYINLNPNDAKGYEKRGLSYQELRRYQEALTDYDKAIELNTESSDVYGKRGHIYRDLGQYKEAIKDYDKWLKLDPETLWPYHYKGMAYHELGQYEVAVQNWETYVELRLIESTRWIESEQAVNAYTNIGLAYTELGQYQKAIEYFDKILDMYPNNEDVSRLKKEAK